MNNLNINNWIRYSVTFRVVVISFLVLLLLIPLGMVKSVVRERQNTKANAVSEISQKWGKQQTIAGPVLSVPYKKNTIDDEGKVVEITKYAHFLPDTLSIESTLDPQVRSRGVFDAVVYSSDIKFSGKFNAVDMKKLGIEDFQVDWDNAFLTVGIPDSRGINDNVTLLWGNSETQFEPGVKTDDVIREVSVYDNNYYADPFYSYGNEIMKYRTIDVAESSGTGHSAGISTKLPEKARDIKNTDYEFSLSLSLLGSQDIQFVPVGRTTDISVSSPWKSPSFSGAFLPDERTVSKEGFKAHWKILDLNRGYPQEWLGNAHDIYASASGVKLLAGVDGYEKTRRSATYAVLIIALTFMVFFFVEIFNKKRVHPIQYILVGLAIVLFYTLLVSISEVSNFGLAYLLSSIATIGLIGLYAKSVLDNKKSAIVQVLILSFLYLFVYIILQLEDYALLIGSAFLFVILATIMYITRKIDWYVVGNMPLEDSHKK